MIWVAYIIWGFALVQMIMALYNLLFRERLPNHAEPGRELVSILIPARNEEKNIGALLQDLIIQPCRNIEIIVFDDQSADNTSPIVEKISRENPEVRLIRSDRLPEGWLGKNYACHSLANQAKGDYFLFLDADVSVGISLIPTAIAFMKQHETGLLSIFPRQKMGTPGEWATVPLMHYILLSLLPLRWVRQLKFPSMAAANGQCMLFRASTYRETLPHEKMKSNRVEDIEIARWYKNLGIKIACMAGEASISCRMYTGFGEASEGFSKNVINFFGNSYTAAILFWLTTTFGFLIIMKAMSPLMLAIYVAIILITRMAVSATSRQNTAMNLLMLIPQQLALGYMIALSLIHHHKKSYQWKGRNIS